MPDAGRHTVSLFGLDADTLKVVVPAVAGGVAATIAGAYQIINGRRAASAQIAAAEVAARATAKVEAGRIAQSAKTEAAHIAQTAKSEAEHLAQTATIEASRIADNRAQRVSDEVTGMVAGFQALIDRQSVQIDRQSVRIDKLEAKVETQDGTIRTQRRDMDEVARQKDNLVDRVADLETADKLKTHRLDQLRARLTAAYDYISLLTKQLIDHGHEPLPPPPGLRTQDEKGAERG